MAVWSTVSPATHEHWHAAALVSVAIFALVVCCFFGVFGWRYLTADEPDATADIVTHPAIQAADVEAPRLLDGVMVPADQAARQPYAIMIENLLVTRPQSGLSSAAVVYETLAEGGTTRFMAVFDQSAQAAEFMPVRSARPYYLQWAAEYGLLYGHAGGSPQALGELRSSKVITDCDALYHCGQYYWRDRTKSAPHNLVTSSKNMILALRDKKLLDAQAMFQPWLFKDEVKLDDRGVDGKKVSFNFSTGTTFKVEYRYNRERNVYLRFNANKPHLDKNTDTQIEVKNVIVQLVDEPTSAGEKGRLNIKVVGEGAAWMYRDGQVIEGTWKKESTEGRTRFYDAAGTEISFNRGNTWVHVVPKKQAVTNE